MSNFPDPNAIDLTALKGDTGATGATGASGATPYQYVAYATDAIGSGWSLSSSGKTHFAIVFSTTLYEPITEAQFNALSPNWLDFTEDIATLWDSTSFTNVTGTMPSGWASALKVRNVGDQVQFKGSLSKTGGSTITQDLTLAGILYSLGLTLGVSYRPASGVVMLATLSIYNIGGAAYTFYATVPIGVDNTGAIKLLRTIELPSTHICNIDFTGLTYFKTV